MDFHLRVTVYENVGKLLYYVEPEFLHLEYGDGREVA